jgi:Icc-related predicted phosphoesterase
MALSYFVSDLHGHTRKYDLLFDRIRKDPPELLFLGGDLLPHGYHTPGGRGSDFISDTLVAGFSRLKGELGNRYPSVFLIMGNDDPRINEETIRHAGMKDGLWQYIHNRKIRYGDYQIYGYSFIPPSPFGLKDWEKYDVSRYVDPGCTHPCEGMRTVKPDYDTEYSNIKQDLEQLVGDGEPGRSVFLFHSPPYNTSLDRAALDGKMVDYVPLDVHVGSIAIQRFIEAWQPLITMHGHIHEASRITGRWCEQMGGTWMFNASNETHQLPLVQFDLENPAGATRKLLE